MSDRCIDHTHTANASTDTAARPGSALVNFYCGRFVGATQSQDPAAFHRPTYWHRRQFARVKCASAECERQAMPATAPSEATGPSRKKFCPSQQQLAPCRKVPGRVRIRISAKHIGRE